ncbi:MAG: aldose 1-epimerase family protein [Saprospiraceae bacterium]|nr:aldose 1-epimerase family protein [Saprospiraceae bacterium]
MKNIYSLMATMMILTGCATEKQHLFTIENDEISVEVSSVGAELKSLKTRANGLEYLWQANPNYWPRSSPLLFPVIGTSFMDSYLHEGLEYSMPQHGFARDYDWKCLYQQQDSMSFELRASAETQQLYPFDFVLQVNYTIEKSRLRVHYQVRNEGKTVMPFAIGGHPGFKCPLKEKESRSSYSLVFEQKESLYRYYLTGAEPDSALFLNNQKRIAISNHLFESGAIILKHLRSSWVGLQNPDGNIYLKMNIEHFPYFAIWTKAEDDAHFICLEPWQALPGTRKSLQQISDKEGAILLAPQDSFLTMYEIEI